MAPHDIQEKLLGERQVGIVQMERLARMNRPEKTANAMVMVQRQCDKPVHVHVTRIVLDGGSLGLEDWLR